MSTSPAQHGPGACPSPEELFDFSVGRVTEPAREAIARHIEAPCPRCEAALLEMADRKDPLIADLAAAPPLSSADAEEACRWVLDRVPAAGPSPSLATTDDYVGSQGRPAEAGGKPSPPAVPVAPRTRAAPPLQQVKFVRVVGPGGMPGGDLKTLLRRRLLFATTLLACLYSVYLFKIATFYRGYQFDQYTFGNWLSFFIVHATICTSLIIAALLLWSGRSVSLPSLRLIEVVVVGLPLLNQLWLEYQRLFLDHRLLFYIQTGTEPITSGRTHVLPWFVLIIFYGILFPNKWRHCWAVVGAMAGTAFAINVVAAVREGVALRPGVLHHLLEVALWLAFGVAFAVYNSYRIEVLDTGLMRLGQYRLLRRLGGGGMGEVYQAEHALLRRPCAVKLIRPERAIDPNLRRRFEQEAQKTAALTHPNTIVIYDYGQADDGRFYYAMEYLPGVDLKTLVEGREERPQPLPPGRVVFLLRQVCGALGEAHAVGLIHRDIKPSNVIACVRGGLHDVAKLLDFGLVRIQGPAPGGQQQTEEGKIVGTTYYMSPEQAAGEATLDHRTDLYSLGATAYFLLTGRLPFTGKNALEVIIKHARDAVVPPSQVNPGVPDDLQAVVLRCLEKTPARRFQSAEELEEALAGCACAAQWDRANAAAWWREHGTACQTGRNDT
jgi:eukaryotic-like serine/threonine-protein kinase